MKKKRTPILDEMMDSCRLMSPEAQSALFFLALGVVTIFFFILTDPSAYFVLIWIAVIVQIIFILLLIKKNIVYREILKNENAIQPNVIWIKTRKDVENQRKRKVANILLIIVTLIIFYFFNDFKILLVNGLFCLLFSLKLAFYVPLVSVRIINNNLEAKMYVIDKIQGINIEFDLSDIIDIKVYYEKLLVTTRKEKVEIPIDFNAIREKMKLENFLKKSIIRNK